MVPHEKFLAELKADLLSAKIAVDASWITKITEEMATLGSALVRPIALPDFRASKSQELRAAPTSTRAPMRQAAPTSSWDRFRPA